MNLFDCYEFFRKSNDGILNINDWVPINTKFYVSPVRKRFLFKMVLRGLIMFINKKSEKIS